jgi:drug/metabolite transporter (DMT)-like permease
VGRGIRTRADQRGQQRHGLPARDDRQAGDAVIGPVADVGVESSELAAGPFGHLLPARFAMTRRPGLAGELGQRHGVTVTPRGRVVCGQDEPDRVVPEVLAVDAGGSRERLVLPLVGEHEIDVSERERRQRLLGFGFDELAAEVGRVARELLHRRHGEVERDRLEGGDPPRAGDPARSRRQLGLGELGALEQRICVTYQDECGVGQPDASPGRLEQRHSRLALEHGELLGDGRRRELQCVGDRGDRAARVQLVQQAEPAKVEHSQATLPNSRYQPESLLRNVVGTIGTMSPTGTVACLASAAAFGAMGIFGKLAYDEGANVGTLLATRFVLAAALLWLVVFCAGRARDLRTLSRRDVGIALALGAVGYGAQAGGYFAALQRLDASLLSLLVYTFPVIVAVTAIALGRERASCRTAIALALASIGLVLVLAGAAAGALDALGTALGLGAAVVYSAYILSSEGVAARVGPLALTALVCTGAALTLTLAGIAGGDLHPRSVSAAGFAWLGGLAVLSTVGAIALFFAGLRRVGPTAASILSTLEPVVTVVLAFAAFGESLGRAQLAGGALVLAAVLAVRAQVPRSHKEAA